MKDESGVLRVRPRALVRYLGLLLGIVIGAPQLIGCLYFLLNISEVAKNPVGAAFCFVVGFLSAYATYRWMTICGEVREQVISLRGWLGSCTVFPDQLADIRKVWGNGPGENASKFRYDLFDHNNQEIGRLPNTLALCVGFDKLIQHMQQLAAQSRKHYGKSSSAPPINLAHKPREEWTLEDLEQYKREKEGRWFTDHYSPEG